MFLFRACEHSLNKSMKTWHSGYRNFLVSTFEQDTSNTEHTYTCEIKDVELMNTDNIQDIFTEHVAHRQSKHIEVLYSGGLDSEFVLTVLRKAKLPVSALTLEMRINGITMNTHDLYYAEKFCRERDIKHNIIVLDIGKFYHNGDHLSYLLPYHVVQANVATQFYLLEQATGFPIIGGDWPWLQTHVNPRRLSPSRLDFMAGDLFMRDRGIHGINNMISYSLDSCNLFVNQHYKIAQEQAITDTWGTIGNFKTKIFKNLNVDVAPSRIKAYGWEAIEIHNELLDMREIRTDLLKRIGKVRHVIKWDSSTAQAASMLPGINDKFK